MSTITVTAIYMSSVLSLVSMIVPLYSIRLMQLVVPAVPGLGGATTVTWIAVER